MEAYCHHVSEDGSIIRVVSEAEEKILRKELGIFIGRKGFNWKTLAQIIAFCPNQGDKLRKEKFLYGLVKMGVLLPENAFLGTGYLAYITDEGRKSGLLGTNDMHDRLLFESRKDAAVFVQCFQKIYSRSDIGIEKVTREEIEINSENQEENWLGKIKNQGTMSLENFI